MVISTDSGQAGEDVHVKIASDTVLPGGEFAKAGTVHLVPGDVAKRLVGMKKATFTDAPKRRGRPPKVENADPTDLETRDGG